MSQWPGQRVSGPAEAAPQWPGQRVQAPPPAQEVRNPPPTGELRNPPSIAEQAGGTAKLVGEAGIRGPLAAGFGTAYDLVASALNWVARQNAQQATTVGSALGLPAIAPPVNSSGPFPVGGADTINRGIDTVLSATGGTPLPPEARENVVYQAVEGAASPFAPAAILRAAGPALQPATSRAGNVINQLRNNYAFAPRRTLLNDAAAGGGAAAAGQVAEDAGFGTAGQVAAALGGGIGVGGMMNTTQRIMRPTTTAVMDRLSPGRMDPPGGIQWIDDPSAPNGRRAARPGEIRDAAAVLQTTAFDTERTASNIESGAATFRAGGLTPPTTSALSDNPRLALLERARRNADTTGQFREHDRRVDTDIARAVESPQGSTTAGRAPARTAFEAERDAQLAGPQRAIDQARDAIPPAQQNLQTAEAAAQGQREILAAPPVAASEASRRLDDILVNQTLRPAQQTRSRLYEEIKYTAGGAPVDAAPLQDVVESARQQLSALRGPGSTIDEGIASRLDLLADSNRQLTVSDLVDTLPYISRARLSAKNSGQITLADNMAQLRDAIRVSLDGVADPDAARAIQATFDFENSTFALFRRGEINEFREDLNFARRLPNGQLDRVGTPPSATLERFWSTQKGAAEKAADLESFIAASPDPAGATEAITNYVMADLAGRVVAGTGQVDPGVVRQMIFDYQNAGLFNGPAGQQARAVLQQTLTDVMSSNTTLTQARATLDDTVRQLTEAQSRLAGVRDQIRNGPLGLVLDANGLGVDPLKAAARIRASDNPVENMRAVTAIAASHGEKSLEAWRAAVGRELYESVMSSNSGRTTADGPLPVDFGKYMKTFEQNRELLSAVMAPEQMNVLNLVAKIMKPLQSVRMTGAQGSQTVQNSNLQTFFRVSEITLKSVYGGLTGGNMFRNMKLSMQSLGLLSENPAVTQLIQRSFFDPELAAYLYRSNPEMPVSGHTAFLRRFFALGETVEEE